jgi:hypothetical protein
MSLASQHTAEVEPSLSDAQMQPVFSTGFNAQQ